MELSESMIFGGFSIAILLLLFIYVIVREKETKKRLNAYEKSIEAINKNIYQLEKKIDEKTEDTITAQEIERMKQELVSTIKQPIYASLETIKETVKLSKNDVETRMSNLEEKAKEYMSIPISASLDESRVMHLFKNGYTVDDIARELRSNVSEINFLLKVKGLA